LFSLLQQSLLSLSQPSNAVSGLWMLTMLRPRRPFGMVVGGWREGGQGHPGN